MDFNKKQPAILYIDTNKAYYAIGTDVLQIDFPGDVIADLELVNKEKFDQLFSAFITDNKLPQGEIAFVFATATLFEQDFEETLQGKVDAEVQKYLDLVPFDDVFSKVYKLNKKTKVVAINKRIYENIKAAFKKNNFSIVAVTPFSLLQEFIPELATNIDFTFMLTKLDVIRQYSMLSDVQQANMQSKAAEKKPQTKNKMLYVYIGIFGVLLIVLVIVIIMQFQPSQEVTTGPKILPPLSPVQKSTINNNSTTSGSLVPKPATSSGVKITQ